MPDRRSIFRLLALAGFLLTVALALWLAELRPLYVILVMAAALAVAWAVEWLSWHQDVPRVVAEGPPGVGEPVEPAPPLEPPPPLPPVLPPEPAGGVEAELGAPPMPPEEAGPPSEQDPEAPSPAPEREPPARPPLRPVPPPPPEPLPPPPTPPERVPAASVPAPPGVVDLRMRATAAPRRWNLWDLERRARDEQERDPDRYEEWSYLFVHLRQFATPDGSLPTEFDGLVRESFGDLLDHAG